MSPSEPLAALSGSLGSCASAMCACGCRRVACALTECQEGSFARKRQKCGEGCARTAICSKLFSARSLSLLLAKHWSRKTLASALSCRQDKGPCCRRELLLRPGSSSSRASSLDFERRARTRSIRSMVRYAGLQTRGEGTKRGRRAHGPSPHAREPRFAAHLGPDSRQTRCPASGREHQCVYRWRG